MAVLLHHFLRGGQHILLHLRGARVAYMAFPPKKMKLPFPFSIEERFYHHITRSRYLTVSYHYLNILAEMWMTTHILEWNVEVSILTSLREEVGWSYQHSLEEILHHHIIISIYFTMSHGLTTTFFS